LPRRENWKIGTSAADGEGECLSVRRAPSPGGVLALKNEQRLRRLRRLRFLDRGISQGLTGPKREPQGRVARAALSGEKSLAEMSSEFGLSDDDQHL
jgi:hypothetical protein